MLVLIVFVLVKNHIKICYYEFIHLTVSDVPLFLLKLLKLILVYACMEALLYMVPFSIVVLLNFCTDKI